MRIAIVLTTVLAAAAFAATPPSGNSYVSDLPWISAANGWGPAERDMSNGEKAAGDGHTLSIGSKTYAKGVGVHAAGDIAIDLGGGCSTFTSDVGIDNEAGSNGSVVFQVWADGTKLFDSGVVRKTGTPFPVSADITGRSKLDLIVTDGGDGNTNDHGDWANAQVSCGTGGTSTGGNTGGSTGGGTSSNGSGAGSGSGAPAGSISVSPGTDLAALASSSPAGAVFYLRAGVHRFGPVQPKDSQQFIGEAGAVLNGSKVLSGFSTEGSYWVATNQFQAGTEMAPALPGIPGAITLRISSSTVFRSTTSGL